MPSPYLSRWLELGRANRWITRAVDPPFTETSFAECRTVDELLDRFEHGNWCLGQAFYLDDLCFIQQVDGGDEWLTIKQDLAFESISFGHIIRRDGPPIPQHLIKYVRWASEAWQLIEDLQRATLAQCKALEYRRGDHGNNQP